MRGLWVMVVALLLVPVTSVAAEGQWHILASSWHYDPSGTVTDSRSTGDVTYDVDQDLQSSDGNDAYLRIAFEHRGVNRSNAALFVYQLETRGGCDADVVTRECGATGSGGGFLGGLLGGGSATVAVSSYAKARAPTVAWWTRLGNDTFTFDLGASISYISGEVQVRDENDGSSDDDFDAVVPAFYGGLNLYLHPSLKVSARANGISVDDNAFLAVEYGVSWLPLAGERFVLGAEAGYRQVDVKLDNLDNDDKVDIRVDGFYLGAVLAF